MITKKRENKNRISSAVLAFLMSLTMIAAVIAGATDYILPEKVDTAGVSASESDVSAFTDESTDSEVTAKLLGIPLKNVQPDTSAKVKLIPCGSIFGVKFFTKGVMIVGMSDVESTDGILNPSYKSGLRVGDIILEIDGFEVNTVEEIAQIVEVCDGRVLQITFERDGERGTTSLLPLVSLSDGKYKTGLWVRDSTAGIGTITYYNPETGDFGGLGHGICDVDTGKLMPMLRANVVDITITDIVKGIDGMPGEIKGSFGVIKNGVLYKNTEEGVFGNLVKKPLCAFSEPIETAPSSEIQEGEAFIYASLGDDVVNKYSIELTKIYRNESDTKNFIFSVKDRALLDRTGGIVQGMSGSPIVQDGRLVGAVTHVLVNDPTKGYGIFIENMLAEANK